MTPEIRTAFKKKLTQKSLLFYIPKTHLNKWRQYYCTSAWYDAISIHIYNMVWYDATWYDIWCNVQLYGQDRLCYTWDKLEHPESAYVRQLVLGQWNSLPVAWNKQQTSSHNSINVTNCSLCLVGNGRENSVTYLYSSLMNFPEKLFQIVLCDMSDLSWKFD